MPRVGVVVVAGGIPSTFCSIRLGPRALGRGPIVDEAVVLRVGFRVLVRLAVALRLVVDEGVTRSAALDRKPVRVASDGRLLLGRGLAVGLGRGLGSGCRFVFCLGRRRGSRAPLDDLQVLRLGRRLRLPRVRRGRDRSGSFGLAPSVRVRVVPRGSPAPSTGVAFVL